MSRGPAPVILILWLAVGTAWAQPPEFKVVVHAENPAESIDRSRLSKMFLKRLTRWENDQRVECVDQVVDSEVREAFSDEVHNKSVNAIKSFWQRMIFSGRDEPPVEKRTDQEVIDFVRTHRWAVGYVSPDAELGEGVKELALDDETAESAMLDRPSVPTPTRPI